MLETSQLAYYREGHLTKESLDNIFCCHIAEVTKPVFDYLELVYQDGSRKYVYEDAGKYAIAEENFQENRFTSFFEFFTTEELATEKRGIVKLEYFVRRPETDYVMMSLEEAKKELSGINQKAPRMVTLNHYDTVVNYHEEDL